MSGGAVRRRALQWTTKLELEASAKRDLDRLIGRLHALAPLQVLYDLTQELELERDQAFDRAAACALFLACGDFVDDLADGDVDPERFPLERGPSAGLLCFAAALEVVRRVSPPGTLEIAVQLLPQIIAAQQEELDEGEWTRARYERVCHGFAALQYKLYAAVLAGPEREDLQRDLFELGVVGLVASDILDDSTTRFWSLPAEDRRAIMSDAGERASALKSSTFAALARVAVGSEKVIDDALRTHGS